MNRISIIIPVIRPERVKRLVDEIYRTARVPRDSYEILTEYDTARDGCPATVRRLVEKSNYNLVAFLGDDTIPMDGWLKIALEAMATLPDGWGLVGLNDGFKSSDVGCTHWVADKRLLPLLDGEFFSTAYTHSYCDNELVDRCRDLGRYVYAPDAMISHHHPIMDSNDFSTLVDPDLKRVYNPAVMARDEKTYRKRKMARAPKRVAVALPIVNDDVHVAFFLSFLGMDKSQVDRILYPTVRPGAFSRDIAAVRNGLVQQAMTEGFTHIIFMDTDQLYPADTINRLLAHERPIVGARVHRRWPPFEVICNRGELGKYTHVPDAEIFSGETIQVDATGTGCILFDMRCFVDLDPPWFTIDTMDDGKTVGEDIGMCAKMRALGYEIAVDTSIEVGHMALTVVGSEMYHLYKNIKNIKWRT